jgi:hypothetical protein
MLARSAFALDAETEELRQVCEGTDIAFAA